MIFHMETDQSRAILAKERRAGSLFYSLSFSQWQMTHLHRTWFENLWEELLQKRAREDSSERVTFE